MPVAHADYDAVTGVITLQTVWNQKTLTKGIPGSRWDPQRKTWTLPASWASLVTARGVFKNDLTVGDALKDWSWRYYNERVAPPLAVRASLEPDEDSSPELKVIKSWNGGDAQPNLYSFQVAGVQFMLRAGSGLLGDEMGSGLRR